jgi:hypothetical protein
MNEFLASVKADLLDRRLLPLVAVVVLALVGAVAFVALGGGSSASTPTASLTRAPAVASRGIAVSQLSSEKAVAETTAGVSKQHNGQARNPFTPLPGAKASKASTAKSATSTSSSSSSSGSKSSGSSGGSSPTTTTPTKTAKKAEPPKTVYHVAVEFGLLPASGSSETPQLTPYEDLKLLTPLPSASQPLLVFRGVADGGKSATFTLVGEAILHGKAKCVPSESQCQEIDLQQGETEQLEVFNSSNQTETYELKIVGITSTKASGSAAANILKGESKAGRELLSRAGLLTMSDLRYSAQPGVLVFAGHDVFGHGSAHRHHYR